MEYFDFGKEFEKYIYIGITEVEGLDLNTNHGFEVDVDISPNFSLRDLYSVGATGEEFVVYHMIPGVLPENYPITLLKDREERTISNSIKNWFPCYLVYKINDLLTDFQRTKSEFTKKDLDSIYEGRNTIIKGCEVFENKPFMDCINEIFDIVKAKDLSKWDYEHYLKIAAKDSTMAEYLELKEKNSTQEEFFEFILKNPNYNAPAVETINKIKEASVIPLENAIDIINRRISIDFGYWDLLHYAAKSASEKISKDSVYYKHIKKLAKFEEDLFDFDFGSWFLKLGKDLVKAGNLKEAVIAFENAIYDGSMNEEYNEKAYKEIKKIVSALEDNIYAEYIEHYPDIYFYYDLD